MKRKTVSSLLFAAVLAATTAAPADDGKISKAFGFDPEDSTRFLQAALDSGRKKIIIDRQPKPWITNFLYLRSNQEIVFEDGVEIVARRGEFTSPAATLFRLHSVTNVHLHGKGTIRMWRDDYAKEPYERGEWRHAVNILSSNRILVEDLTILESGGDGIYIGGGGDFPSENIVVRRVVCDRNYRQGISVTSARRVLIEDCVLSNTAGTDPQAGIDYEPNECVDAIDRCVLRRTVLSGNAGAGVDVVIGNLGFGTGTCSLLVEDCTVKGNRLAPFRTMYPAGAGIRAPTGTFEFRNLKIVADDGTERVYSHRDHFGIPEGAPELKQVESFDYAAAKIVDDKPGQLLEFPPARTSGDFVRYTFYAAKAGKVRISGRQIPCWNKPPVTEGAKLVLVNHRGRKLENLRYPGVEEVDFGIEVPKPGFYSLVARTLKSTFCITKADVPIALDLMWRKGMKRFPCIFTASEFDLYFYMPKKNDGLIFGVAGENASERVRVELLDGGKKRLFDETVGEPKCWFTKPGESAKPGLWRVGIRKPESGAFDNFAVDLLGGPQFFFLHSRRYWY